MVSSSVDVYLPAFQLLPVSFQNALIRELDHTKKLIEESHHEKVRDRFKPILPLNIGSLQYIFIILDTQLCLHQIIVMSVNVLSYRSNS